jgi:hypothetical protein
MSSGTWVSSSRAHRRSWDRRISVFVVTLCLSLLVACGSDEVYGDEVLLTGSVFLDCNQKCQDYGSCGVAKDTGEEVLLLGAYPAFPHVSTVEFKGLMPRTQVEVQESEIVTGILQRTGEEVEIRFYLVLQPEAEVTGWIPGFCIAGPKE